MIFTRSRCIISHNKQRAYACNCNTRRPADRSCIAWRGAYLNSRRCCSNWSHACAVCDGTCQMRRYVTY